jgi:hypothetical protein
LALDFNQKILYISCICIIIHLSKIFNFLSPSTYSSLGVSFFRFPFGPEGGEGGKGGGEGDNNQAEKQRPLQDILRIAEFAIREFSDPNKAEFRYVVSTMIRDCHSRLGSELKEYEQAGKICKNEQEQALYQEVEKIFTELSKIIENKNNCRNPK